MLNIFAGLFIGIMIPVLLISALPGFSIKILEFIRIYKKGSLSCSDSDYITGAGYHRRGKVYFYINDDGSSRFESARVYGLLILFFVPVSVAISVLIYFL